MVGRVANGGWEWWVLVGMVLGGGYWWGLVLGNGGTW